jgi:hypothetical protein
MSVATSEVFPSAKFISTNAVGELQDVESVPATKASGNLDGIVFESKTAGIAGNSTSVEILQDTSGGIVYGVTGQAIQVTLGGSAQVAGSKASGSIEGLNFEAASEGVAGNSTNVEIKLGGDLGSNAVAASLVYSTDVTFSAVTAGAAGNSLSVQVTANTGNPDQYSMTGDELHIQLQNAATATTVQDFVDNFNNNAGSSITSIITAAVTGLGTNNLAAGGIAKTSLSGGADAVNAVDGINKYTLDQIKADFDANAPIGVSSLIALSVGSNGSGNLTSTGSVTLSGGSNSVAAVLGINAYTRDEIKADFDANAPQEAKDLINVSISSGGSANLSNAGSITLSGGTETQLGELDPESAYLLIKQSDLHDLSDDERTDARKLVWGVLHKASTHWAGLASQPDNLKISKSFPAAADNGASLRQVYTVTAKYGIDALDLKSE